MSVRETSVERRERSRWLILFAAMLLLSVLCLGLSLFYPAWWSSDSSRMIPVALHSVLRADYSADAFAAALPPVSVGLIANALQDQALESGPEAADRVLEGLRTPVPTITPFFSSTPGGPTPTSVFLATWTLPPPQPTATLAGFTPAATATPTTTLMIGPSYTPSPTQVEPTSPSKTPAPPTNTPAPPTNTPKPSPTRTPVPPTNTPIPPTNTLIPPTQPPYPPPPATTSSPYP